MSWLLHLERCNTFRGDRFRPLLLGERRVGMVRADNAERLARFADVFAVSADAVRLVARGGFEPVSAAVDGVVERLVADGAVAKWRNENFAVAPVWGEAPLFKLDRGAVPFFGIRAYGVHVNGWRRGADGVLKLWIGRRAPDKKVEPNKLDNLVAGGIGYPHGIEDTLVKEAEEEAGMPASLAARAQPAGYVSYRMEWGAGARDDVLYVYDLETPADFTPRNRDGEIAEYTLMDARDVLDRVRDTDDFKFNVNLVILDFALRHGVIPPDHPHHEMLRAGLRRPLA